MRPIHKAARSGEAFGPYQLVRQLAVGGMAEIYLARATGLSGFEKFVALKMIHPNYAEDSHFIDMLVEEAKIVVHLTQPNIVQIFDLGRIGDVHYIAMEYVDGLDLYHVLRNITEVGELLDYDVTAYIALEICAALDYAHRCRDQLGRPLGIIHRDISPQNILLSKAGEVKLADFGIAKATVRARQTAVGVIKGKYYYMSPEQAWGEPVDHRTDIFSTGVVLYESIVGQMLYLDEDLGVLLEKVRRAEIAPPSILRPGVPAALEEIVLRAVARRPEDRFQSAHEFQLALQRFLWSYAPQFNLGRVRDTVLRAVALEEKKHAPEPEVAGLSPSAANVNAPQVSSYSISFASHSLLPAEVVRTGERKLASIPDWEDDFGEATTVSNPPLMLAHLDPKHVAGPPPILPISVEAPSASRPPTRRESWEDAEDTTDVVGHPASKPKLHSRRPAVAENEPSAEAHPRPGVAGPSPPPPPSGLAASPISPKGSPPLYMAPLPPIPAALGRAPDGGATSAPSPWPSQPLPPIRPEAQTWPAPPASPGPAAGWLHPPAPPQPGFAEPRRPPGPGSWPPPPTFQAGLSGQPEWENEATKDEVDLVEQRMEHERRRRIQIGFGAAIALLLLIVAIVIVSARRSLESPGSVLVESEPTGAKVYYKGNLVGNTPHRLDSLPLDEEHSIRLEHPRCESTPARLPVEAGKTRTLRVQLKNCDR